MEALYLIITFIIAYLIGTILVSRIYISFFRDGNISFYNSDIKKFVNIQSFGTSNTAKYLGLKIAILPFIVDFSKSLILFYFVMMPINLFLIEIHNNLIYLAFIFLIIGNNYPIWWKFTGGDGIAAGLGIIIAFSWFAGIIGFIFWLIFASLSKHSGIGAFIGLTTACFIGCFPGLYETFLSYEYIDFSYWIIITLVTIYLIMLIKQIKANNVKSTVLFVKKLFK